MSVHDCAGAGGVVSFDYISSGAKMPKDLIDWFAKDVKQVDGWLVAFGINISSRYDEACELSEMLLFAKECARRKVDRYVLGVFYDSRNCYCAIETDSIVQKDDEVYNTILGAAHKTLSQFVLCEEWWEADKSNDNWTDENEEREPEITFNPEYDVSSGDLIGGEVLLDGHIVHILKPHKFSIAVNSLDTLRIPIFGYFVEIGFDKGNITVNYNRDLTQQWNDLFRSNQGYA